GFPPPVNSCDFICQAGQAAFDGNTNVYVPAYDQKGVGRPGSQVQPGVWHLTTATATSQGQLGGPNQVAPNAGFGGNQPTAVAVGPDGKLYVGFLKNGDIVGVRNPQLPTSDATQVAQKIGGTPNGRPVRALAFVGNDLYIGTSDSLSVIKNATSAACTGG